MFSKAILTAVAVGLVTVGVINAAPLTNDELQALKLINDARLEMAIPALIWDPNLQEDANMWAGDVANHGFLEHAPESQRNGADELLSFFHSVDKTSIQLRNPIRESAKMWLESNDSESNVKNSWESLSLTEQLLSAKAAHIGCASVHVIDGKGAANPQSFYTVCRVRRDIHSHRDIARRQDTSPGPFTGDITFFNPALGACGWTDNDNSMIVALSHIKMGTQSNGNPLCGRKVRIEAEGNSVEVTVTDKCMGCAENDIDVSPAVFQQLLGDLGRGRVGDITWRLI
ncbi:hypothetical protein EsH8_I_001471 [Colletotrichum jinshuiense]